MKKVLGASLLLSLSAFAQPAEEIKQLREEIEVLKEEIRKLRLEISMPQVTTYQSYTGLGPAASKALLNPKGVSIGGYGEIWLNSTPQEKPSTTTDVFRYILYLGYAFNEKLKFNSEIEIEHAKKIVLEFAFLDYRINKHIGVRGGQILIPLGITNEYHEPPTYFSVKQPYLEKKLFPFTWKENGIGVYGETDLLEFRGYVINPMKVGTSYDPTEPLDSIDQIGAQAVAEEPGLTARVDFNLPANLKLGVAGFYSPIFDSNGTRLGSISILSPHLWWQYAGFDVRFVGALADVSGADKITAALPNPTDVFPEKMRGFYLQTAYNVLRFFDTEQELYVFAKVENVDRYNEVPSGYSEPSGKASELNVLNFGLSYKPHPLVALKADYARENYSKNKDLDVYSAAITWMF